MIVEHIAIVNTQHNGVKVALSWLFIISYIIILGLLTVYLVTHVYV
jgi:hypothetical protein